jgi:hypothetical protein
MNNINIICSNYPVKKMNSFFIIDSYGETKKFRDLVFDNKFLLPSLTLSQNLLFFSNYFGIEPHKIYEANNLKKRYAKILPEYPKSLSFEDKTKFAISLYLSLPCNEGYLINLPQILNLHWFYEILYEHKDKNKFIMSGRRPPKIVKFDNFYLLDYFAPKIDICKNFRDLVVKFTHLKKNSNEV